MQANIESSYQLVIYTLQAERGYTFYCTTDEKCMQQLHKYLYVQYYH